MGARVKLLLFSDLHLGGPLGDLNITDKVRLNTFKKIVTLARRHDVLIIAGDLVDSTAVKGQVVDIIRTEFRNLRDIGVEIFYCPGSGELTQKGQPAQFLDSLNATYIFSPSAEAPSCSFIKEDQRIILHGFTSEGKKIQEIQKTEEDGYHIGIFYAHINSDGAQPAWVGPRGDIPILARQDLKNLPLDLYAFGSSHNFRIFKVQEKIVGVCPGSPEAAASEETGDRYVVSVTVKDNTLLQIKRHVVNTLNVAAMTLDCASLKQTRAIQDEIQTVKSRKTALTLKLIGERNFVLNIEDIEKQRSEFHSLRIIDLSVPTIDALIQAHESENTIRGEFYRIMKERIANGGVPVDLDWRDLALTLNSFTAEKISPPEAVPSD